MRAQLDGRVQEFIRNANGTFYRVNWRGGLDNGFVCSSPLGKMENLLNIATTYGAEVGSKINKKA